MAINYFENLGFGRAMNRPLEVAQSMSNLQNQALNRDVVKADMQQRQQMQQAKQSAFEDAKVRERIGTASGLLYSALSSGQPERAVQLAQQFEQDFKALDPTFSASQFAQMAADENGLKQLQQESLTLSQILAGPEQVARFTAQQAQPERAAPEPARVAEFRRWIELNPDATIEEKRQVYNQMVVPQERAFATGQGSGQARVSTEQQLNPVLAERARETAEAQQGTAAGQAALTKAQADAQAAQRKIQEEETRKIQQVDLSRQTARLAREIAEDPNFERVTGVGTMFPTILPESQDVILKAEQLISLLTADNLKLMSGVLTDRDIQMLSTLSSGMRVTDKGIRGSAPAIRKRLQQIAKNIDEKLGRAEQVNLEQQPAQQAPQGQRIGRFIIEVE